MNYLSKFAGATTPTALTTGAATTGPGTTAPPLTGENVFFISDSQNEVVHLKYETKRCLHFLFTAMSPHPMSSHPYEKPFGRLSLYLFHVQLI